jgi:hypothetical protein
VLALLCGQHLPGAAAELDTDVKMEILALLDDLGRSGCRFNRNGTWYGSAEAEKHLKRKFDYLADKALIESTERFIERGASRSSMSGKDYRVECPGQESVSSASWLTDRLRALREVHRSVGTGSD